MKKISVVILCLLSCCLLAQSNKLDKKMEKAYALVDKDKLEDAGEYLEELLEKNPEYGKGWDYLGEVRLKQYNDAKSMDKLLGNLSITTKDKDNKDIKDDTTSKALLAAISAIKPSKKAWNRYIYTLRKGLLNSEEAYNCSFLLRNYFVDREVDTAVNKKALKHYDNAEEEFGKKNYDNAAKLYKRAIEEQPDFYKASLYMGDCFFFTQNYVMAISSFKSAKEKFPDLLEPRKYLVDAYLKQHLYPNALEESIACHLVYPDLSLGLMMEDALYYSGKRLDFKWTRRAVFPNKIPAENQSNEQTMNAYTEPKPFPVIAPWTFYQGALAKLQLYCDKKGIVTKTNNLTSAQYLEVFGWEEMLKNSNDPALEQARKMQTDGYLDCYVLISCFHFDFYAQYADFVSKNKEKVEAYYKKYTVARG